MLTLNTLYISYVEYPQPTPLYCTVYLHTFQTSHMQFRTKVRVPYMHIVQNIYRCVQTVRNIGIYKSTLLAEVRISNVKQCLHNRTPPPVYSAYTLHVQYTSSSTHRVNRVMALSAFDVLLIKYFPAG
jgi:hypothetical protein